MGKIKFCISVIILLLHSGLGAQNPYIRHYTTADGLPTNTIYQMCQDSHKFLWFTSDAGVIKFDGSNFTSYRKKDGLSSNEVVRIKEDFKGRIWLFNYNSTVNYYYKNTIYNDGNEPFLKKLVGKGFFLDFITDSAKRINFYNYQREVYILDKNNNISKNILLRNANATFLAGAFIYPRVSYLQNSSSNEWTIWTSYGIYKERKSDGQILYLDNSLRTRYVFPCKSNSFYAILYNAKDYIIKIDPDHKKHKILFPGDAQKIRSIIEDSQGFVWVAATNEGLYCFRDGLLIKHLQIKNAQSLLQDHEQNIWVGTSSNGIYVINHDILTHKHFNANLFNQMEVNLLFTFPGIGVGCLSGNTVSLYDGRMTSYKLMVPEALHKINLVHLFKNNTLVLSEKHTMVCLFENLHIDKAKGIITYSKRLLDSLQLKGIVNNRSGDRTVFFDQNRIFSTTSEFPSAKNEFVYFNERINNVYFNTKDEVVVNANKNYIFRNKQLIVYPALAPFNGSIISDQLIINDSTELFNVDGDSLYLLIRNRFYNLTKAFSSPINLQVKKVLFKDSKLFLATLKEIFICNNPLNVVSGKPVMINQLNFGFNNINDILLNDSSLYIASDDGLTVIPQASLFTEATPPPIPYIRSILVNNVNYPLTSGGIKLKGKNYIQLSFGCISYLSSAKTYSYMLEGAENKWSYGNGSELELFYRSLPPGQYTFKLRVRATSEWSKPLALDILIKPTLFEYPAFWAILIVLAGFLVIMLIYRIKNERIRKTEVDHQLVLLEQKALQSMMNPHFIFNSLGSIQNYLLKNQAREAVLYLSEFTKLIRQNLNAINSPMVLLEDEVDRLRNYLELEKKRLENKFTYNITVDPDLEDELIYIPSMILQPIVENSIWHGIASLEIPGNIEISFSEYTSDSLMIKIKDNGIGMQKSVGYSSLDPKRQHLGMQINAKRLALLSKKYNTKTSITYMESDPGNPNPGTQAILIVPYKLSV